MAETTSKGTDVALIEDPQQIANVLLGLGDAPPAEIQDPEVVSKQIVERILAKEGRAALQGGSTTKAREILKVPLEIAGVQWMRSKLEDNQVGLYALIDAHRLDDGEPVLVTCGGQNVLAQLLVLYRDKAFPVQAMLTETEEPTANGYRPQWLVPVEKVA